MAGPDPKDTALFWLHDRLGTQVEVFVSFAGLGTSLLTLSGPLTHLAADFPGEEISADMRDRSGGMYKVGEAILDLGKLPDGVVVKEWGDDGIVVAAGSVILAIQADEREES